MDGARSILLSITGGRDLSLLEVERGGQGGPGGRASRGEHHLRRQHRRLRCHDQVWVTVIATRFDGRGRRADGNGGSQRRAAGPSQVADAQRPAERRAGTAKNLESQPRDLELEVPEFLAELAGAYADPPVARGQSPPGIR